MTPLARLELREERPGEVPADGGPAAAAGLLVAGVRRGTARPLVRPLVRGPQPQPGGVLVTSVLTSCGDTGTQSSTLQHSNLHPSLTLVHTERAELPVLLHRGGLLPAAGPLLHLGGQVLWHPHSSFGVRECRQLNDVHKIYFILFINLKNADFPISEPMFLVLST